MSGIWHLFRLKGVAHVLAAENSRMDKIIMRGITTTKKSKRMVIWNLLSKYGCKEQDISIRVYEDGGKMLADRMMPNVIDYCNIAAGRSAL